MHGLVSEYRGEARVRQSAKDQDSGDSTSFSQIDLHFRSHIGRVERSMHIGSEVTETSIFIYYVWADLRRVTRGYVESVNLRCKEWWLPGMLPKDSVLETENSIGSQIHQLAKGIDRG